MLLAAAAAAWGWAPRPAAEPPYRLQIVHADSGDVWWQAAVRSGDEFVLSYVHSVELSPVAETYAIGPAGEIAAMESRTRSFGAGLPHTRKGVTTLEDGYYVMKELNEPVGELHVMPSHLHRHTLRLGEQVVELNKAPYAREHLVVRLKRPPLWKAWLHAG